ncbi:Holliday junction branch migration protein RuvA [Hydrogenophilus thiooxidans]|uniref:Holliday junction branch migration protein RuvA n=1 Tax=Hydrogenophilus thiooxidans TaxID=2820326 RepID=UPI001C23136B|nr:Holliday junction branch migration protein RuvA [Hydrogenophilus thiooxidans]
MIATLTGTLREKTPPTVLIETAGGVGYEVWVPMSTFYTLPATGETVQLVTHHVVRDDEQQLFGFATRAERDAFRLLIRINGVGPRIALALLSHLTLNELKGAVAEQQSARLVKIPGIGKKTAERLLLELKDKLALLPFGGDGASALPPSAAQPRAPKGGAEAEGPVADTAPQGGDDAAARWQLARDVAAALVALGYSEAQIAPLVAELPSDLSLPAAIKWALQQVGKRL